MTTPLAKRLFGLAVAAGLAFLSVLGPSSRTLAQALAGPADSSGAPTLGAMDAQIIVRADRTWQTIKTYRISIRTEAAIDQASRQNIFYIEGMQTSEIVNAYTEKADGRRMPVDPSTIVKRDASGGAEAMYRDLKQITVFFPDVAVGDNVVLTVTTENRSSPHAGQIYETLTLSPAVAWADSTIRIAVAKTVALRLVSFGPGFESQKTDEKDAVRHSITVRGQNAGGAERSLVITSFPDLLAVGRSYWASAEPKAVVTPQIRQLADEITRDIHDRRAQAQAISVWVKRNIRYVAVYLGDGRIVPNDTATILRNRYGDCKDHVTLAAALLAAKNIASEQVLVNAGTVYDFHDAAAPSMFNHVMLYLPEFRLYDDPTIGQAAFGVLTAETYDKPVLHASRTGVYAARTPAMKPDDYVVLNQTKIFVAADGSMTGETLQVTQGTAAMVARAVAKQIQNDGVTVAARKVLQATGHPGSGRYDMPSPSDLSEPYIIRGSYRLDARLNSQPGTSQPIPHGMAVLKRPGEFLLGDGTQRGAFRCLAGRQVEIIELTFADGLPMPGRYKGRRIENRYFTYTTDYEVQDRTLTIKREFVSRVTSQMCSADVAAEIGAPLKLVASNIQGTRLYFPKPEAGAPGTDKTAEGPGRAPVEARGTATVRTN